MNFICLARRARLCCFFFFGGRDDGVLFDLRLGISSVGSLPCCQIPALRCVEGVERIKRALALFVFFDSGYAVTPGSKG